MNGVRGRTHFQQKDEAQKSHHEREHAEEAKWGQHLTHSDDTGGNVTRRRSHSGDGGWNGTSTPDVHSTVDYWSSTTATASPTNANAFIQSSATHGVENKKERKKEIKKKKIHTKTYVVIPIVSNDKAPSLQNTSLPLSLARYFVSFVAVVCLSVSHLLDK